MKLVVAAFVAVALAQVPDWGRRVADTYIALGGHDHDPASVNCTRYASLFTANGILHQPGTPDVHGWTDIESSCATDHTAVNPLISFETLNIPVTSWNTEKRLAFSWVINGVRASDGQDIYAPVISQFFMNPQAIIEEAWSFYDDTLVTGLPRAPPPFNGTVITQLYTHLGSNGGSQVKSNCAAWVNLFTADGINNEPGVPPSSGAISLRALCDRRSARWSIFLPSVQVSIPVMSWNTDKRLAFQWTITGQSTTGQVFVVPAISVLFMNPDGTIKESWDSWDESNFPPPPPVQ